LEDVFGPAFVDAEPADELPHPVGLGEKRFGAGRKALGSGVHAGEIP
jgi:hypothetical protein